MASGARVERGYSDEPVNSAFGLEPAVRVGALDPQCRRFEPSLFARAFLDPLDLAAMRLRPAKVHPDEHFGPVLRLRAARPGVNLEIGIVAVRLAREKSFHTPLGGPIPQHRKSRLGFIQDGVVTFGFGQFDKIEIVRKVALESAIAGDGIVEAGALAHELLRRLGVVPQLGVLGPGVQLAQPFERGIPVKDASLAAQATA